MTYELYNDQIVLFVPVCTLKTKEDTHGQGT